MPLSWPRRAKTRKDGARNRLGSEALRPKMNRGLRMEPLEARQLLAIGPQLVSITPNEGPNYSLLTSTITHVAPRELTLTFAPNDQIDPSTLTGIQLIRSGGDGVFGNTNDILIPTTFAGMGQRPNEVVFRIGENIWDDQYQLILPGSGATPIKNMGGQAFNNGANLTVNIDMDLAPFIQGVVPQPITRQADGSLSQSANTIDVYFNADSLAPATLDPSVFQLIWTNGTPTTTDDQVFTPLAVGGVTYTAAQNKVTLTFAQPLDQLVGLSGVVGPGNFRLRIGNNDAPLPNALVTPDTGDVAGSSFGTSLPLGTLTAQAKVFNQAILAAGLQLSMPGGDDEPGHRDIPMPGDLHVGATADDTDGQIATRYYNFQAIYGTDPISGTPLFNQITAAQKQRVREIFELYGNYLGVQFVESPNFGFTIATGDLRAVDPQIPTGPGSPSGIAGGGEAVMNNFYNWGQSEFAGGYFQTAMHEVGHLLGLDHSYDLAPLTVMGNEGEVTGVGAEPIFPGDADIIHGQRLYKPESTDIDLYAFSIDEQTGGRFNAEITAERLTNSSLLNSVLTLYKEIGVLTMPATGGNASSLDGKQFTISDGAISASFEFDNNNTSSPGFVRIPFTIGVQGTTPQQLAQATADAINGVTNGIQIKAEARGDRVLLRGPGTGAATGSAIAPGGPITAGTDKEVISRNDDYYSNDSFLSLDLQKGNYWLGVTSTGNTDYDPNIIDSGFGGTTQGQYELRVDYKPVATLSITDNDSGHNTVLDGDLDGKPGGVYNMWFDAAGTAGNIFVDKAATSTGDNGTITNPFHNISDALALAARRMIVPTNAATLLKDGDTFVINDRVSAPKVFEFDNNGSLVDPLSGHIAVSYTTLDSASVLATKITNAINTAYAPAAPRASSAGAVVTLSNGVLMDLSKSPVLLTSASVVRIVGNGGSDSNFATQANNLAYEIGTTVANTDLQDGRTMEIPQGVTVMVDAGVIFKMHQSNIDVGSSQQNVFRGGSALQLLGTPLPGQRVFVTSYFDETLGVDTLPTATTVGSRGDYGGLVFRADSDLEDQGIFMNMVDLADIRFGGGQVVVNSVQQAFSSIHLVDARPSLLVTLVRDGAQASVSADPNSFHDNRFYSNAAADPYGLDYDRVGPKIYTVRSINDSINGLQIRINNELGQPLNTLDTWARFDDTDIVHVLNQNLSITATPGGAFFDSTGIRARTDGRLAVDPGVLLKIQGSRIDTTFGSQFIAEGSGLNQVVLTSYYDDRFGRGGSFDTNADDSLGTGERNPGKGDWGGIYFGHTSTGSIDDALITFAGGRTAIEGGFANFNPIEIQQARVRVTNTVLEQNDNGVSANTTDPQRHGRLDNRPAQIFVRGAQPILVNNSIHDNNGDAININVNSLNFVHQADTGRSTGPANPFWQYDFNVGPMVRLNKMSDNSLNGMAVRGGTLTTESIWDDTDIVHVVRDEIAVVNHHTYSGLRLESATNESLVVKLIGATAGFTANGTPLDIDDRIGGTVQLIGNPLFPVVLTSLDDDTIGAGVDRFGQPMFDTNANGSLTTPTAGNWRSVRFDKYSNDRNVKEVNENEVAYTGNRDANGTAASAEFLGTLGTSEQATDEKRRLGFEVNGTISYDDKTDVDVYSFNAVAGTEIWIDVDRTRFALDTVVELVDANGTVQARSSNSPNVAGYLEARTGAAVSMIRDAFNPLDLYTVNPKDAGMRLVLPGATGQTLTYFVRVRSAPLNLALLDDPTNPKVGGTSGHYSFQIRLHNDDEKAGSTVRSADIRYASTGVEVLGMPAHSPLLGESADDESPTAGGNEGQGAAQNLGNLLQQDRNTLSVAGRLASQTDVDWYSFTLDYAAIQKIGGVNNGTNPWSTIFDIDYTDGAARPDTTMAVFNEDGTLIYLSSDSDITQDQPRPTDGGDATNLAAGSFSKQDAFIGNVDLQIGATRTYYVAITSNTQLPTAISGTFLSGSGSALVRLEPVNSVKRVAEDHINATPYTGVVGGAPGLFSGTNAGLNVHAVDWSLSNVSLFVNGSNSLTVVDPFTGALVAQVTTSNLLPPTFNNLGYHDLAMRNDGRLYGFTIGNVDSNSGNYVQINTGDGSEVSRSDDGIITLDANSQVPNFGAGVGVQFEAMDFFENGTDRRLFAVGSESTNAQPNTNLLFELNPDTGHVVPDGIPTAIAPTDDLPRAALDVGQSGATILVTAAAPTGLIDGDTFKVNSVTFEWDSGPEIDVNGTGAGIVDLSTFTVLNAFGTRIYRFNKDPANNPPDPGKRDIFINNATTATQIASFIEAAINDPNQPPNTPPGSGQLPEVTARQIPGTGRVALIDSTPNTLDLSADTSNTSPTVTKFGDEGVASGNQRVTFTAFDPTPFMATTISIASNNSPLFPSVQASSNNSTVTFASNLTVNVDLQTSAPELQTNQLTAGNGGHITGIEFIGNVLYAVTETGRFLEYNSSSVFSGLAIQNFQTANNPINFTNLKDFPGVSFTGLRRGPDSVEGGAYNNLLFATTTTGDIIVFDTSGAEQPIFLNGASRISTGITGLTGLNFSTLDYNLFHATNRRTADAGKGINAAADGSRIPNSRAADTSFYFGLEDPRVGNTVISPGTAQPDSGNYTTNAGLYQTYNTPGGAYGTLESDNFNLFGYSATDKPTLYFNYFLDTQNAQTSNGDARMRDSFRVSVTTDNGATWQPLTTNNSERDGSQDQLIYELTPFATTSGGVYRDGIARQRVGDTFDNTGQWRQARVDLGDFAGMTNLRMRFDFSTSGAIGLGQTNIIGTTLRGIAGDQVIDGQTITISGAVSKTFELDVGFSLVVPGDAPDPTTLPDGSGFVVNGQRFEYDRDGAVVGTPVIISITSTMTTTDIVNATANALISVGLQVVVSGTRIYLGPTALSASADPIGVGLDGNGPNTVNGTNVMVTILATDTAQQVINKLGAVIEATFNPNAGAVPGVTASMKLNPNLAQLQLIGHNVTGQTIPSSLLAGIVLPYTSVLQGDSFGNTASNRDSDNGGRGMDNSHEGVYLDDFIIGTAERGEMVTGAGATNTGFFQAMPQLLPNRGTQNLSGEYQLEVRRGTEYARATPGPTIFPPVVTNTRSFDTNDRFTETFTLLVPTGRNITDGTTFTVNDGVNTVTFEFDRDNAFTPGNVALPVNGNETATQIAGLIAGAINAQSPLLTTAEGGSEFAPYGDRVQLFDVADVTFVGAATFNDTYVDLPRSNATPPTTLQIYKTGKSIIGVGQPASGYVSTPRGDENLFRDQGEVIVEASRISHTLNFAINVDAAARDASGNEPHPGSPRQMIVLNDERLVPGILIENNLLFRNTGGGISFSGDTGNPLAAVPFGRIVNNTIYGSEIPVGVGVQVTDNASPTLLNNIFSGLASAITVDATSQSTVVGGSVYKLNTANYGGQQSFPITLAPQDPLFVNPAQDNYNLKRTPTASKAIDSSIDSLEERTAMLVVFSPIGIDPMPILAPTLDLLGQTRGDDPLATSPPGQGSNVFKDRGALESTGLTTLDVNDVSVLEGNVGTTALVFTISISNVSAIPVTVNYRTLNGTAVGGTGAGFDYVSTSGSVTFASGETTKTVTVFVNGDTIEEPDETMFLELFNASGALLSNAQGKGTILDDDRARISVADTSAVEGDNGQTTTMTFTLSLSKAALQTVTVSYSTADGTAVAGTDYTATSGTATFAPGALTTTVTVNIIGDNLIEGNETLLLNLTSGVNANIADDQGVGTIIDNEPTLSVGDASVVEGNSGTKQVAIPVTLSKAVTTPVTVNYSTADLTANAPTDYLPASGTLTFQPGELVQNVFVTINGDTDEEINEQFVVNISGASTNVGVSDNQGVVTIVNDDARQASINDVALTEGNSGTKNFTFTVSLDFASAFTISMNYATVNGTAVAPGDYTATSGTLVFAPGETSKTITVAVNGDTSPERTENFTVQLSAIDNAVFTKSTGIGTIIDDDTKDYLVTGADAGGGPHVQVFQAGLTTPTFSFFAYAANFTGGVRVATADVNGDGTPDIITAPGSGGGPHVRVFSGVDGSQLPGTIGSFMAYETSLTTGLFVAAGDIDFDGKADVIVGTGNGVGENGRIRVFSGATGAMIGGEQTFDQQSNFTGGVRVAAADVNGDGRAEVVAGAGPGSSARLRIINWQTRTFTDSFPFGTGFTGGLFVSSGYVNNDPNADVIVAAGQGGGPHVKVYNGAPNAAGDNLLQSFFAYAASFSGGVRVGATDFNKDGLSDIITGQGPGGTSQVKVFSGANNATLATFNPYGAFSGGDFVAGSFRQVGSPLMAAGGQSSGHGAQTLQQAQLDSIVRQAITNYSTAGLSADQINKLKSIKVGIADLKDGMLGEAFGSAIYVDTTAAGYGYFVDSTPGKDEEFTITRNDGLYAAPGSLAAGKIDLLSVVEHEMGHILGLEDLHSIDGLMHEDLGVGVRHHIDDAIFGNDSDLFDGI